MSFDDDFPSLKGFDWGKMSNYSMRLIQRWIINHCLDKKKIKEAIDKNSYGRLVYKNGLLIDLKLLKSFKENKNIHNKYTIILPCIHATRKDKCKICNRRNLG